MHIQEKKSWGGIFVYLFNQASTLPLSYTPALVVLKNTRRVDVKPLNTKK
jgi:hypothetical protein